MRLRFSRVVRVGVIINLLIGVGCSSTKRDSDEFIEAGEDTDQQTSLPHPQEATPWGTQTLVLSGKLPPSEALAQCREQLQAAGREAVNPTALNELSEQLEEVVEANVESYHWCFYSLVVELDAELDKQGMSFQEKGQVFVAGMRYLWVLAKALSRAAEDDRYFIYIQARYVQISNSVFARSLIPAGLTPRESEPTPAGSFSELE